ncbi:MAG TPA: FAD-dependent oxidoreductase [Rhodothermales bacterium]|nr:FAD-dependent oxidoreductase [Rhodothermales bacterium]
MQVYTKAIKDTWESDVLVVGSGSAGSTAAITAARQGARVALVERYGFMGGTSTQVLDTFYGFYTPGRNPLKVVAGVPDLVVQELQTRGVALTRPNTYGAGNGITYDPETLKSIWEILAQQAGVRLLYHTFVIDALTENDRVCGAVAVNKGGLVELRARVVIDASGDADVSAAAGVAFEGPQDGPVQSLTTTFRLFHVDTDRAQCTKKDELHRLMRAATEQGYDLPRREGSVHTTPFPGVMATNMTRIMYVDATDAKQLTAAEIEGRRQALEYARFLRDFVPGYENAVLAGLSHQIGIRESRRIFGAYRLTRQDVVQARKFEDAIARCGAPIEDHHAGGDTRWEYLPENETYDIPYRCLLPERVEGLLVAGRCLSADHDAHASVRSMGQCMAMGQAAGAAAVLASEQCLLPREVSIIELQQALRATGAIV